MIRLDSRRPVSGHAPVIHRLILSDMLSFPNRVAGHVYIPEMLYFYLFGEVVRAGVWLELPLCPDHVVVAQPHYALLGWGPAFRHQIGVTICASGNFWLGARGRIPRLPGH